MISGGTSDPWRITNEERAKHDQEFLQLNPINGFVTGDQAKSLFLQSGLPPAILGHIWSLADMNADGKMDRHEFSIAMHLIHLKLKGIELPKVLPPVLKNPPAPTMGTFGAAMGLGGIRPIMSTNPGNVAGPRPVITNGSILMGHGNFGASNAGLTGAGSIQGVTPINQGVGTVSATPPVPLDTKPRSASNTSQDSSSGTLIEWAVPHQAKLRYTQTFNTHDRTRTGFLSGNQARNILLQSGLPHPVLALIWTLSDIDSDGRLTCEEFCVAMHLSDMSKAGDPLPTKLPIELIPPSYRRRRTSSVQSVGGSPAASVGQISQTVDLVIDDKQFGLATFEDKRKMNFEKGQAELEKRRQALLESQRREQEARERKEREEQEKRERIRQEQERRRQMELEKQLAKQREIEQEKEEQRRKVMEQREAARREMERQRQLEWERQRRQDLMSQRQKEQETVCHLKAKNKNLTYDLEKLNEKMNELNATISDTRNGVSEIKSEIDSMKGQRDKKVTLINSIKLQLKEHNDKMLLLNQEKVNLESKLKSSSNCSNPTSESMNIVMHSFNNKQITLDQLRDVLSNIEKSTAQKLQDIEGNNSQLKDAKNELTDLIRKTNALRKTLEQKRNDGSKLKTKEESKNSNLVDTTYSESEDVFKSGEMNLTASNDKQSSPTSNAELTETNEEIVADTTPFVDNTSSSSPPTQTAAARTPEEENRLLKYRVLYAFEARNEDELSIMPGDIVMVPEKQDAEPGWLGGELKGRTGWFPSAYAELVDNSTTSDDAVQATSAPIAINIDGGLSSPVGGGIEETVHIVGTEMKMTLSGISEAPEGNGDAVSIGGGSEVANDAGNNTNVSPDVVYDDDASNDVIQHSEQSSFVNVTKTGQGAVLTESTSPIPGQGEEVEGLQAQALFPWRAKKENHLTFNKDDVINVKEQQDMWWYGDCDNKVGWFPKSYVKLIAGPRKNEDSSGIVSSQSDEYVNSNVNDSNDYYMAMYAYQSNEIGDLTFNQGDIILVTKMDGDWWTGIIGADRCGIFPSNYVQKVDAKPTEDEGLEQPDQPQPEAETESTNANTVHVEHQAADLGSDVEMQEKPVHVPKPKASRVRKPEIATVIAPYTATGSEQLTLQRGQLIQVRKRSPSGWWEGELQAKGKQRQIGWFPASYVKLLSSAGSTPNTSARSTPDITRNCNDSGITSSPSQEQVCVLFSYEAQNSDEMSLAKGDIITVINKDDPSWWKGASQNGVSGLFPANYVQPVVDRNQSPTINEWMLNSNVFMNLDSIERKRQISIHELIDTEQSYMEDMSIVLDVFYKPLKKSCVLSENELQVVFVNWTELIMCNTKILKALRVRKKMSPDFVIDIIGDILCETIPMLTPYIRFCSCQLNAAALIQQKTERSPEFKSVAKKCARDKRAKGMPLSSFLLKPMQRITKYPLLIKKIMEFTPDNHPDHNNLVEALSQAQLKCNEVNEGVRERENSDRLEWLQTHVHCEGVMEKLTFNSVTNSLGPRKYLHSGTLTKVKSNKELMGFLVNDFLLLAQPMKPIPPTASVFLSEKATNSWYRMYKQPLCLNDVTIKQNSDGDDGTFQIVHCDRIYTVKTVNSNERNVWVKKLEEAITFYKETEKKKLEKQNSLKFQKTNGVGRLLVVVCEGIDLTPSSSNRDGRSDPYCELSMGSQEHKTKVVPGTLNPKWNASMQFLIKDLKRDVLCITVYDRDLFSPNDFLGRTEVRVADIYNETSKTRGPIVKILNLYEVDRGQVSIKVDLHLFEA